MHHEEIKMNIRMRGMTFDGLDKKYGLPRGTCSDTGRNGRPDGERAISEFLNLPLNVLWPDRYDEDGIRYIRRNYDKSYLSRKNVKPKSQNSGAAA